MNNVVLPFTQHGVVFVRVSRVRQNNCLSMLLAPQLPHTRDLLSQICVISALPAVVALHETPLGRLQSRRILHKQYIAFSLGVAFEHSLTFLRCDDRLIKLFNSPYLREPKPHWVGPFFLLYLRLWGK